MSKEDNGSLRELERFIQQIADLTPVVINVFDLVTERDTYISSDVFTLLGYTPEEIAQMEDPISLFWHPEDIPIAREQLARSKEAAEGEISEFEYRVRRRDGQWRWLRSRSMPFSRDEHGAVRQIVTATLDVTERKQAEELLRRAHDELEQRVIERTSQLSAINEELLREIDERERAEAQLLAVKGELDAELGSMNRLYELSTRLLLMTDLQPLLEEVLDATMALLNADFGYVQLCDPATGALKIVAQRGFQQEFLDYFNNAPEGTGSCGTALQRREQVIVEDVQTDPIFAPHLQIVAAAGYRAVQSTPMFSRRGKLLGMISTHFREPRRPSERELRLTDLYARQAAEMIERRQSEERLREYEKCVEGLEEQIVVVDRDYRYRLANRAFLNYRGLTRDELVGHSAVDLMNPGVFEQVAKHKLDECLQGKVVKYELRYNYPKLGERDLFIQYFPIEGPHGVDRVACVLQDITERQRAEEQIAYHAYLLDNLHDTVIATDERLAVMAWNKGAEKMYGWRADEALGRYLWEVVPVDLSEEQRAAALRELEEMGHHRTEAVTYRKDGTPVYVEGVTIALRGEQGEGRITGYVNIRRDITERKRAEEERRQLLRQLMAAQEEERSRIALQLHDQMGQDVSALSFKLSTLKAKYGTQADLGEQLDSLKVIAQQLSDDIDFLIWELLPTALSDLGLVVALSNYVKNWSKHFGIHAELHTTAMEKDRLTNEIETVLYRVTQEALTNVAKHAEASSVSILLVRRSDQVSLIIEDNGVGFDGAQAFGTQVEGVGLIGMRERLRLVGGALEIESQPGDGVTIVVRVPAPHVPSGEERNE